MSIESAGLRSRVACVRRTWTLGQRLHVGAVEWDWSGGSGMLAPDRTWSWDADGALRGFADAWLGPGDDSPIALVEAHLAPDAPAELIDAAIVDIMSSAPSGSVAVLDRERHLSDALRRHGARPEPDAPWSVHLWRDLTKSASPGSGPLPSFAAPAGFEVRPVRPDETAARVAVHRAAWAPARIKQLLGQSVDGTEGTSRFTEEVYARVRAAPDYRSELDLVVATPSGDLVASALGWLDAASGCVLFEPVGTVPAYAGHGLARAVCHGLLQAARHLGATQALVGARGDPAYPIPRRTYAGLGMRPVARTVPFAWAEAGYDARRQRGEWTAST